MVEFSLTEEQKAFSETIRRWVDREFPRSRARQLDNRGQFAYELWDAMADAGFHGIGIEEKHGGQGSDMMTEVLLCRGLARSLGALAWIWGISSFAGAKLIGSVGSEEQRQRFLPDLAKGQIRFAFSVTEPGGGTDVLGAMTTRAVEADGGWRLTGQKIWSTTAHVADYLMVFAITDPDAARKSGGKTVFIVPRTADGVETRVIPTLGERAMGSCEVFYDDVFVGEDMVLGEVGRGWQALLGPINYERILGAAVCTGMIDGVLEECVEYVKTRTAFGKPIGQFQALQHYIADIAICQRQAELVTLHAAWRFLRGEGEDGVDAAMAKVVASEHALAAADLGIQIFGGLGYSSETDPQRFWRDARVHRLGPISNEMARNFIAESFGLPRSY
jgi:acyl-CoA dehydrogenase